MEGVKSLLDRVESVKAKAEENKKENEKLKERVDALTREVNRKDGHISELLRGL